MPAVETPSKKSTPKIPESPVEIKTFSQEQKEALEKQGYVIYGLTGKSIKSLKDSGRKFWLYDQYTANFEALPSMHSEVAINRKELFLPKSQRKTFDEQVKMVEEFSKELSNKIPGVEAIMGQAVDYIELAFAHLDKTQGKDYLFGESDNCNYTRTKTPTVDSCVALVGTSSVDDSLDVDVGSWDRRDRSGRLGVAPLVVPIGK